MSKENFSQKFELYKQQIESEISMDIFNREQKQKKDEENRKLRLIQENREHEEMVIRTKEVFRGTGILETFQEIIDKRILVVDDYMKTEYSQGFFGKKIKNKKREIIPAYIVYDTDSVILKFDEYTFHYSGGEFGQSEDIDCYAFLKVKKVDNSNFIFSNSLGGSNKSKYLHQEPQLGDNEKTIDNIARFLAENRSFLLDNQKSRPYPYEPYKG